MDIGGRQGSRITGRIFAKLMDVLAEEVIVSDEGIKLKEDFIIKGPTMDRRCGVNR